MESECRVLVLDDDELITSSLRSLLSIEGINDAVFFNIPTEALEYLKNHKRDVIISDFMMEEMNGIEFLSKAKELYQNSSMILLTGYADKENAIKAINEVGLYKYIEKPWDNDELIINIKNASERANLIEQLEDRNKKLQEYSLKLEELVKEKTSNLIEMNERLSAIINNCADSILVTSDKGEIEEVNPVCEILFGMSKNILYQKNIKDVIEEKGNELKDVFTQREERLIREINAINVVNGERIPIEINSAYIPEKNKYVFVIRNVNYQKEMERLREDFIAALTHDLRTPSLAAIQTLEYFLNGKLGELNSKQKMLLETMKKSHEDMLGLVNTLLEVYKYESGRLNLVKTSFRIEKLIDECIMQIEPIIEKKNQKIDKIIVNDGNAEIYADRNEIRRVITNLIGNATKYTQEGGQIEIKAEIKEEDLLFSVKDNGDGIYKKDIPLLFKRFSQGTQTKRSIGTGLGLYLSKQIIDAHGGKIWLESDKGKGSEFFFLLQNSVIRDKEDKVCVM